MPRYTPPRFLSPESQPTSMPAPWLLTPPPPPPFLPPPPHHHQNHFIHHHHHSSGTNYQKGTITVGGLVALIILCSLCSVFMPCGGRYNRQTHPTANGDESGNRDDVEFSGTTVQDQEETARRTRGGTSSKEISLPPVVYHKRTMSANCAVCLECLADGDECRVIPACNHVYHLACIDRWLENNTKCPLCRSYVWEKS